MKKSVRITILHTNDYHGKLRSRAADGKSVGGAPQRAALIRNLKRGREARTFLVDAGDMAQGSLASKLTRGRVVIDEMNSEGYDLAVIGNHDLDWGLKSLEGMAKAARFPMLAANVRSATGDPVPWIKAYVIRDSGAVRVAFVGVTTPDSARFLPESERKLLSFIPPFKAVRETLRQVRKEKPDLVVLVSHLGLQDDRKMARRFPGLAAIVGGHSHSLLPHGQWVGRTLVVQAGSLGEHVGELTLTVRGKKLVRAVERLHRVDPARLAADPEVRDLIAGPLSEEAGAYRDIIGISEAPLTRRYRDTSNFPEILADALREAGGTPVAMVLNYGVADELPAGPISRGHLEEVVPWDEKLLTITLSGRALKSALEHSFLDESHAILVPSGFTYHYDWNKPEGSRVSQITMGGRPLNPRQRYTMTINAHDLRAIPSLARYARDRHDFGLMREALACYIEKHSPLKKPDSDGRVKEERG